MRKAGLLIAAIMVLQLCGCDGEMWISTGDDGWTSDTSQSWPPTQPAASVSGSTNTKKKTAANKNSGTTPAKTEKLELTLATPATAQPGTKFSVSLTVTNSTGAELKNLVVEGVVPGGLKVTDASGRISMRWGIPSLAAGESKSLTAVLTASAEGSYELQARATAEGGKTSSSSAIIKIAKEKQDSQK